MVEMTLHKMTDEETGDTPDTVLLTKPKAQSERPPLYKVMLINDDYTPMEFVVYVLQRFFGINHDQARKPK